MKTIVLTVVTIMAIQCPAYCQPKVGAYYYPWHGAGDFAGGHSTAESLRGHLDPAQGPLIGDYSNRDDATISSHIDQSHRGNIDFWALSWWGPDSPEDETISDSLFAHSRASELEYAIHYESTARLGTFESPNFSALIPDFRHMADNYFGRDDYLRVDGRPVVMMYLTRAYFNSQASRDAVASLRQTIQNEYGYDPYIVGDDVYPGQVNSTRAELWDAITDYDVYGTALKNGSTGAALNTLAGEYDSALSIANDLGIGFIPTASPGFNDSGVRTGHAAAPRYMEDSNPSVAGELFSRMLSEVVVPRTHSSADNILMVNSFNEWHEDTQIEASNFAVPTNVDNSGVQQYTEGHFYEGYGYKYLDILRNATSSIPPAATGFISAVNLDTGATLFKHDGFESDIPREYTEEIQNGSPLNPLANPNDFPNAPEVGSYVNLRPFKFEVVNDPSEAHDGDQYAHIERVPGGAGDFTFSFIDSVPQGETMQAGFAYRHYSAFADVNPTSPVTSEHTVFSSV